MLKKNKKSGGFTLIELLVVIAIIGLLSTLSLVALNVARQKARDALRTASIKQIMTALELEYNETSAYPSITRFGTGKLASTTGGATTTYMGKIPVSPTPWVDGHCSGTAGTDAEFVYSQDNPSSYHITYCLAGVSGSISGGVHRATPVGIANP